MSRREVVIRRFFEVCYIIRSCFRFIANVVIRRFFEVCYIKKYYYEAMHEVVI